MNEHFNFNSNTISSFNVVSGNHTGLTWEWIQLASLQSDREPSRLKGCVITAEGAVVCKMTVTPLDGIILLVISLFVISIIAAFIHRRRALDALRATDSFAKKEIDKKVNSCHLCIRICHTFNLVKSQHHFSRPNLALLLDVILCYKASYFDRTIVYIWSLLTKFFVAMRFLFGWILYSL